LYGERQGEQGKQEERIMQCFMHISLVYQFVPTVIAVAIKVRIDLIAKTATY
jgi:hypothetical protein